MPLADKPHRSLGSIYTPLDFAQFLTRWAVRSSKERVLDVGVGEGAFAFSVYERLRALGAPSTQAQRQVYGSEIDRGTYSRFLRKAEERGLEFPNVQRGNFFDLAFPEVEALTGNPPYVRRAYLKERAVKKIRRTVMESNPAVEESELKGLTDLYVYFLLRAMPLLKPGGRLAVITADSWLNTRYGECFKRQLQEDFVIERLISLDRRVFDASVKPLLLLATKKPSRKTTKAVEFIRLKNGLPINDLQVLLDKPHRKRPDDVLTTKIARSELKTSDQWGMYFKAPGVCERLAAHPLMCDLATLGDTRIGIQTLAKEFFVLSPQKARELAIEARFLQPLAQSTRCIDDPVIEPTLAAPYFLFYCSESKVALKGTQALKYIKGGEATKVTVRGKGTTVVGYQNKERIKEDKRERWYDLKTPLVRRSRATILIPRLIYRSFMVVWNKADFVPGELFIEFLPHRLGEIEAEVYLAVLSSSVTEIMLRSSAQIYGAGTYNIAPGRIKSVPVLNVGSLSDQQRASLKTAYQGFLLDAAHDRTIIDNAVHEILGTDAQTRSALAEVLDDMHLLATSAKQSGSIHDETVEK
jgi:hypothetical protein